jgi:hypothetical protein
MMAPYLFSPPFTSEEIEGETGKDDLGQPDSERAVAGRRSTAFEGAGLPRSGVERNGHCRDLTSMYYLRRSVDTLGL